MGGNPQASGGSLLACPDVLGEIDAHPRARRQGRRRRPAPHRHRRPRRRVDADRPGHRRRVPARDVQRAVRRGSRRPRRRSPTWSRASTTCARCAPTSRPKRSRDLPRPGRHDPPPRPRVRGRADRRALRPHRAVQPGVRHARVVAGRRRQHPHRQLRPSRRADVRQARRRGRWPRCRLRPRRRPCRASAAGARVRGAPEVLGQVPASCLAEEIATPGDGQIKALVHVAGNPVLSVARRRRGSTTALPELECMISVDNWLNETTRHAHVILPGLSPLEQPHYDELLWGWAVRSGGNWSATGLPAAGRPPARVGDPRPARRGCAPGGTNADVDVDGARRRLFAALCRSQGRRRRPTIAALRRRRGPERIARPARSAPAVGRPLRRGARRPDARARSRRSRTASTSARWCPASARSSARPTGKIELAPDVHRRRRPASARHAIDRSRRRPPCSSAAATCARTTRGCTT